MRLMHMASFVCKTAVSFSSSSEEGEIFVWLGGVINIVSVREESPHWPSHNYILSHSTFIYHPTYKPYILW